MSLVIYASCTRDVAPEITCEGVASYDTNIKTVIETNCSYSGCHDGSPGVPGVYLDFDGIEPSLNDGTFEERVANRSDMPPSYATGPTTLTQEELDLIICWISEGYPEN